MAEREEIRRRILDAAKQVFFERSFEGANLDRVAGLAGIAKGTIYRYFDSKAELYVEVLVHNSNAFVERMRKALDGALPVDEQVRRLGLFYFHHYTENPEYFRIFWALENQKLIGALPDELVHAVSELWRRCLQILADEIARGVREGAFRDCDPWEMANLLWSMANGLLQTEGAPERRALRGADLEGAFERAIDVLIAGLRTDRSGRPC